MTAAAVIVAAGAGLRAGGERPKQYQLVGGKPVLRHTVEAFLRHPGIGLVQVVIGQDHVALYEAALGDLPLPRPVIGGETRQHSVARGLDALRASPPDLVLIHDGARPFVSASIISHVIAHLDRHPAVVPALPITDTVKRADGNLVTATVDRTGLWAVQTPQGFRFEAIAWAHKEVNGRAGQAAGRQFSDDASIAEWAGIEVALIAGSPDNVKVTSAEDIAAADQRMRREALLALGDIRVGQGFDVHAFVPGDHVTLCGVRIAHDRRLSGHSDADAPLHALTDALLGAIAEGDIGVHFPPSDPQWRGADSAIFLRHAAKLIGERGGIIANADLTIVCEAPRIAPHVAAMRQRLSDILGLVPERIAIKATTSEAMGFTGRGEGLVAMATATVRLPG
jgi:2-C-methyl-D-erythritol 4-phosphate cytidylyltransferase / 2-C-methyl-D-erythritol 2,4-cyclodiphosphate synthase